RRYRQGRVIDDLAPAEETGNLLVDEIEREELGVPPRQEHVPGQEDRGHDRDAEPGAKPAQESPRLRQERAGGRGGERKQESDQSLGQSGERGSEVEHRRPGPRSGTPDRPRQAEQRNAQAENEERIGEQESAEEEGPERRRVDQGGQGSRPAPDELQG